MTVFIFTFCLFVLVGLVLSRGLKRKEQAKGKCEHGGNCGACGHSK
jgi:hypothetical protein